MKKVFGWLFVTGGAFLGGLFLGASKPEEVKKVGNNVKAKVRDFSKSCLDKISVEPEESEEVPDKGDDFEKVD